MINLLFYYNKAIKMGYVWYWKNCTSFVFSNMLVCSLCNISYHKYEIASVTCKHYTVQVFCTIFIVVEGEVLT